MNSKILTVQTQYGDPVMWVLVDTKELAKEKRHIIIYATGHRIYVDNNDLKYISTFQIEGDSGDLVFHVFELIK